MALFRSTRLHCTSCTAKPDLGVRRACLCAVWVKYIGPVALTTHTGLAAAAAAAAAAPRAVDFVDGSMHELHNLTGNSNLTDSCKDICTVRDLGVASLPLPPMLLCMGEIHWPSFPRRPNLLRLQPGQ